ncbi:MAG: type III pantothenate kinase [Rhodospirillaceae bacterium]|jgi:type III pantothenate kinase|nr:type III pantothenate kinase [Rhodospirillaceae bacterium]MBT5459897.1 type III pantothenate kinase [Rhodospirillaceae bacterium]
MLLAIDSGNTNIVFAVYDGEERRGEWRASSDAKRTADEYGVWLNQLMAIDGLARKDITDAIIATVVPETLFSLKSLCRKYFSSDPMIIGDPEIDIGVGVLVSAPDEVGADRLINAAAAHWRYGGPLIVIDFGTATTFDIVDADGNYFGGVIAPGINLSLDALHMAAAKLPRVAVQKPESVIGKRTVPAMMSGVYWGYVGLIEGLLSRIKDEFGAPMAVVATGGLAPLFAEATDTIQHLDPDLTLRGLAEVHRRNKTQQA